MTTTYSPATEAADALRWASRSLAAEVRALETGRRANLDRDRHCFVVLSDTVDARYTLRAHGQDGLLVVTCTCPARGHGFVPGRLTCWHSALVARRLERERLARRNEDGLWSVAPRAGVLAP